MSATYCLAPFMRALPNPLTADAIRAELAKRPETCDRDDCSPGGCRALCREWATVQWKAAQRRAGR